MASPGSFLHALDPAIADALRAAGRRKRWPTDATIFLEGEPGGSILVLLEGRVKAFATTLDGRELILSLRGAGDLLGEIAALSDGDSVRTASVVALEPVVGQMLTTAQFETFLLQHPKAALVLLRSVLHRLEQSVQMRIEYGAHDVLGRVARRLCELAEVHGEPTPEGIRVAIGLSQDELATWVVASREGVTRVLARLRKDGSILTDRKSIVVVDLARLRKLGGLIG